MKRTVFTLLITIFLIACGTAQTKHAKGVKIEGSPEVTAVPATRMIPLIDTADDGLLKSISLANLASALNLSAGSLTQEEVEDILGAALTGGTHTNATVTYNDATGTIDIDVIGGASDGNDFPTSAFLTGNVLTIAIPNQTDVTVDLSSIVVSVDIDDTITDGSTNPVENNAIFDALATKVGTDPTSPEQNLDVWKGTQAEYNSQNPTAHIAIITDGAHSGSGGGGVGSEVNDLTASVTWANIPDANVPETAVTQHEAALSVTKSQISDFPITTSDIGTREVTGVKIALDAITSGLILDGQVTNDDLAANAVTTDKIATGGITNPDLADNSVNSDKINNLSILNEDLANNSINSSKISDGTVGENDLNIANSASTNDIMTWNGSAFEWYGLISSGSFTPVLEDNIDGAIYTYTVSYAEYYKVGNMVTFTIRFVNIGQTQAPTGVLEIDDMPFSPAAGTSFRHSVTVQGADVDFYDITAAQASSNMTFMIRDPSTPGHNTITWNAVSFTSGTLTVSGTYFTN